MKGAFVPDEIDAAVRTFGETRGAMEDVRQRLGAVPPELPGPLATIVATALGESVRDLTEVRDYLHFEATDLGTRSELARNEDLRESPFGRIFGDLLESHPPSLLGEQFGRSPYPRPVAQKEWWETGPAGFFVGAGKNVYGFASGVKDLAELTYDGQARSEAWEGLKYAASNPKAAYDLWVSDVTAQSERDAGNASQAAGYITVEVASTIFPVTKLRTLAKLKDAHRNASSAESDALLAEEVARVIREGFENGPGWRDGSEPWAPPDADWHNTHQREVIDRFDQEATAARGRANDAVLEFASAQEDFDRWTARTGAVERGLDKLGGGDVGQHLSTATQVQGILEELADPR